MRPAPFAPVLPLLLLLLLAACDSVRTVYDEFGNVVTEQERPAGGEKDITAHMQEKWSASFSEQKNAQGVPVAVSNRVSPFQKKLDVATGTDKQFFTKSYAGADTGDVYATSYAGADKKYTAGEAYTGSRIDKELHPAFAGEGRGLYSTADSFAAASSRYGLESQPSPGSSKRYATSESYYSREMESGYIESRRGNTPPPRVMTRGEYYQKSVQDTRAMLGRDSAE